MRIYFYLLNIFLATLFLSCKKADVTNPATENPMCNIGPIEEDSCTLNFTEMNGVSFENVSYPIDMSHVTPITAINASWVTTMPFGYVLSGDDSVRYNSDFQWYGEKKEGVIATVNLCHEAGLKVMIKPHIWTVGAGWIGDLEYSTEESWQRFERSYLTYVMEFARVADSTNAEAFCIGVEMRKVVRERPDYWPVLIDSIRSVYNGPITYAANWDNFENVTFWNELDYIGLDAYFPLSESKTPTFEECYTGWENSFQRIKSLSETTNKKVIFTEYGFRNVDYTGKEPWDENDNATYNSAGQENAYRATFCRFWGESWFEGGFLWKWHPTHDSAGGESNNRFTPQNKPVEAIISSIFEETN